ncbi:TPA: hypothetical protein HA318_03535 [Candidatus Micrarchaeota archaeon]|nr:MAG: hypothetical protein AUJ65_03640 [Candidatus Micrarchaeota archaeon CG1_02_51_15]HII39047.1 hypothetical protein [Candidatus Micrarchaeota archaeon]
MPEKREPVWLPYAREIHAGQRSENSFPPKSARLSDAHLAAVLAVVAGAADHAFLHGVTMDASSNLVCEANEKKDWGLRVGLRSFKSERAVLVGGHRVNAAAMGLLGVKLDRALRESAAKPEQALHKIALPENKSEAGDAVRRLNLLSKEFPELSRHFLQMVGSVNAGGEERA